MDIWFNEEKNPDAISALMADGCINIEGQLVVDDPSSTNPEFSLILHRFSSSRVLHGNAYTITGRAKGEIMRVAYDFIAISEEEISSILDGLHFRNAKRVYSAVARAFFDDREPSPEMPQKTLTRSNIFETYQNMWGPGIGPLKTGLEKLTQYLLLFTEPEANREKGHARHYSPNPASLKIWGKLIEKYDI